MGLSMREKKALAEEACRRYGKAGKKEKTAILNELVEYLGCNRKYLIHKLAALGKTPTVRPDSKTARLKACAAKRKKGGGRKPEYTEEFDKTLRALWIFFWYRCGRTEVRKYSPRSSGSRSGTWKSRSALRPRSKNCSLKPVPPPSTGS